MSSLPFPVQGVSTREVPLALNVNLKLVGSNCNMRCTYCYEHDDPQWSKKGLQPAEVAGFIAEFPPQTQFRFLLHGGEPLLYKKREMARILDTIRLSTEGRSKVHIQTNGTLLDDEWIDLFLKYDPEFVFSISIDSLNRDGNRILPNRQTSLVLIEKLKLLRSRSACVGVVSVISQDNVENFTDFVDQLIEFGVSYLTLNKLRCNAAARASTNAHVLSEMEYVSFLENLFYYWLKQRLFKKIQIQPFMSLTSSFSNRICTFEPSFDKCKPFISLYPGGLRTGCDHRGEGAPKVFAKCATCSIYKWCGGGCFGEEKDPTFCEARFRLKAIFNSIFV